MRKASELARVSRYEFAALLGRREIPRHYTDDELTQDLEYARGQDLKADIVLIDEEEGRQLASRTALAVTGVLGILLRAKHAGEIRAIKPEIDLLRSKAHFFVSAVVSAMASASPR